MHVPGGGPMPSRRQPGIGMEEEEPRVTGRGDTGRDLAATAATGGDDAGVMGFGNSGGAVAAAAVDHDHFAGTVERGQGARERGRGVEGRDDDGNLTRVRILFLTQGVALATVAPRTDGEHPMRDPDFQRGTPGLGYQATPYQGRRELVREIEPAEGYDDDGPPMTAPSRRPLPVQVRASMTIPPVPVVSETTIPAGVRKGRGATVNPPNRFDTKAAAPFDDGWTL